MRKITNLRRTHDLQKAPTKNCCCTVSTGMKSYFVMFDLNSYRQYNGLTGVRCYLCQYSLPSHRQKSNWKIVKVCQKNTLLKISELGNCLLSYCPTLVTVGHHWKRILKFFQWSFSYEYDRYLSCGYYSWRNFVEKAWKNFDTCQFFK